MIHDMIHLLTAIG